MSVLVILAWAAGVAAAALLAARLSEIF